MNLLKKVGLFLLTLTITVSITACQSKSDKQVKSNVPSESSEKVHLTYIDVGTPPKDLDKVNKKLNEYLDKKDVGYNLDLVFWDWGDYEKKLQLAANTGEDWDICFTANWAGPYRTMVEKGAFMDISELIKKKGTNIVKKVDDRLFDGIKIDGKIYAVPAAASSVVPGDYFVWNKKLVEKYEIPIKDIRDLKELEPYLKKVKEAEEKVEYPLNVANDFLVNSYRPQHIATPGIGVREEDGKLKAYNGYDDKSLKDEIFTLKDYMDKGYISPSAPQTDAGNSSKGDTWLVTKAEGSPGADTIWSNTFETEVVSYPFGEFNQISNEKAQGSLAAINSQSKNADYAMDFLNRMYEDKELMTILCYGIEGEHYKLEDGKIDKSIDKDKNYDVPAFTFLCSYTMPSLLGQKTSDDPEYKKQLEEYTSKLKPSPILGFNLDRKPIDAELTNIEQTISEYEKNIKTGAIDENYYKEFLEKLDTAGMDKAIKEVQKQLDKWQSK